MPYQAGVIATSLTPTNRNRRGGKHAAPLTHRQVPCVETFGEPGEERREDGAGMAAATGMQEG